MHDDESNSIAVVETVPDSVSTMTQLVQTFASGNGVNIITSEAKNKSPRTRTSTATTQQQARSDKDEQIAKSKEKIVSLQTNDDVLRDNNNKFTENVKKEEDDKEDIAVNLQEESTLLHVKLAISKDKNRLLQEHGNTSQDNNCRSTETATQLQSTNDKL